jgi:hypothetical protein
VLLSPRPQPTSLLRPRPSRATCSPRLRRPPRSRPARSNAGKSARRTSLATQAAITKAGASDGAPACPSLLHNLDRKSDQLVGHDFLGRPGWPGWRCPGVTSATVLAMPGMAPAPPAAVLGGAAQGWRRDPDGAVVPHQRRPLVPLPARLPPRGGKCPRPDAPLTLGDGSPDSSSGNLDFERAGSSSRSLRGRAGRRSTCRQGRTVRARRRRGGGAAHRQSRRLRGAGIGPTVGDERCVIVTPSQHLS